MAPMRRLLTFSLQGVGVDDPRKKQDASPPSNSTIMKMIMCGMAAIY